MNGRRTHRPRVLLLVVSGNVLVASIETGPKIDEADVQALVASIRPSA